jgi:hypothetical protein
VAFNATARTVAFYQNGVILGSSSPYSVADVGTGQFYFVGLVGNSASTKLSWNFGQRPWQYTPPAGYSALTTKNFARLTAGTPAANPNQYFDIVTYTGTGAAQTITLPGAFKPDLVWVKARANPGTHQNLLHDSVRGITKWLISNSTGAEATDGTSFSSFNSDGFTLGAGSNGHNILNETYVAWCWKAGGTAVANTAGTITSSVSVNTASGFSIVTYTGNTTAGATVGHGLGVTPSFIITKNRDSTTDWWIYHTSLGATQYMTFNSTPAAAVTSINAWNNVAPSPTVFTLGASSPSNANQDIAYCWAPVPGFSQFGSYTGNNSTDGPFVYCGFRPRFVLIRRSDSSANWDLQDTARASFNPTTGRLFIESSSSELFNLSATLDVLSNGFKVRNTDTSFNASGANYIYAAFADKPFGNTNGTAR